MKKNFNDFRFKDLNYRSASNNYFTMDRVSADETKIVVKVDSNQLIKTKFGYALVLDKNNVVFLKDWQVSENWFGNEVLLDKKFWLVKEWGDHESFSANAENLKWEKWLEVAKEQDAALTEEGYKATEVKWEK